MRLDRKCNLVGGDMALLYHQFGIRRFQLEANYWPEFDGFVPGQLSKLYGHLNADDLFASCDLFGTARAVFEGEHWEYDISDSALRLRCSSYSSPNELRDIIRKLLSGTREFLSPHVGFFVDEVRAFGIVPDDKDRHIGEVVQKRLLAARAEKEAATELPGLTGAGLRLVGDVEDDEFQYHWHAGIEPPHGAYNVLMLDAQLMFWPSREPPSAPDDLDRIDAQITTTYRFLTDDIKTFASQVFH